MTLLLSDVDERMDDVRIAPRIGLYMIRFRPGCPEVPARIWLRGHEPGDPSNILDRAPHFAAEIAGEEADPYAVMVARERREIDEEEHSYQVSDIAWAREWDPHDPRLRPTRKTRVNRMTPASVVT